MKAVILAGGKGTRLYPYTTLFPKPLVPLDDMPIIEVMLRQLKTRGITEVIVSVGHLAELMMAFLGDGSKLAGQASEYVREESPLGTIGPLTLMRTLPEDFLLMNGDTLTDIDHRALFDAHVKAGNQVTIATYKKKVGIDLGVLVTNEARHGDRLPREAHLFLRRQYGHLRLEPRGIEAHPRGQVLRFPYVAKALIEHRLPVASYPFDGLWLDIGRPADYEEAQRTFATLRTRIIGTA